MNKLKPVFVPMQVLRYSLFEQLKTLNARANHVCRCVPALGGSGLDAFRYMDDRRAFLPNPVRFDLLGELT